ncbi:MAG: glycosyltransferase family 39 protein [Anaerolineae bacterium]|nr:glycosyltransferase family 39 protein [Anaerolineae bacterium]
MPEQTTPRKFLIGAGIILFATALLVRIAGMGDHPWILNGLESSVGLDVQNIASGAYRNPFSSGWQTVPVLPLFLMALPVKLLGSTMVALRLLSPVVGALTVLATFLIGTRLWRLEVGLIAAVLLTGSYFHIHYSRLGIPVIWDGLLMLLALGLLSIAWQESKMGNGRRSTWLWAGIAIGLNAYAYTPAHVMPLILILLLLGTVLFQRQVMTAQFHHIAAAFALALIVALPQILYYNNHDGLFMERFHEQSIFSEQTNWLAQEALFTGRSSAEILWQQAEKALLSLNSNQDSSPAFSSGSSLLSGGLALLFVLGVMMALLRIRQHSYGVALLWLLIPLLWGGVLLVQSPSSERLVGLLPIVCLLATVALVEIGEWIGALYQSDESSAETRKQVLLPVLLIIAALIAFSEMLFYFGTYRQAHTFADRNTEIAHGIADYLNTLPADATTAYFYGPPNMYINFPTIPYLAGEFSANINLFDVPPEGETAVFPEVATPTLTFIFLPERAGEIEATQAAYPGGTQHAYAGYHANPLFYTYEVTP